MKPLAHPPSTIKLGDLEVYRLGFGAMQLAGPMVFGEPRDPDAARAVLRRAVELGVQLIDTSWYYGPYVVNRLIAEALHPYPKGIVLATKLGGRRTADGGWASATSPEALREGCEADLKGLRLERIDVVHLRNIASDVPFLESLDALIALQREGKIRHLALSNVSLGQIEQALERTPIVAIQNLYNVARGERQLGQLAHAAVQDQEAIVDLCAARGMAFLPFFPLAIPGPDVPLPAALTSLAERHSATPQQIALAWLLARSPALLPIPGTSSVGHLEENCAAAKIELTPEEFESLAAARA